MPDILIGLAGFALGLLFARWRERVRNDPRRLARRMIRGVYGRSGPVIEHGEFFVPVGPRLNVVHLYREADGAHLYCSEQTAPNYEEQGYVRVPKEASHG